MVKTAILLINCPDRKGLVAAIANFLYEHDANILHADQHQDNVLGLFFMRVEFDLESFCLEEAEFRNVFAPIAARYQMTWQLAYSDRPATVAIFVSHYLHCLADLLHRHQSGELRCNIALIVSNHEDARRHAEFHAIPFHVIAVSKDTKVAAESAQQQLLTTHAIDLIVLARYMQILSSEFIAKYPQRIINIHHSFLPAFIGAKPHQQAYDRGVKILGATAHYVTEVLDDGPIIEQDVVRVSHRDTVEDLIRKGRDLEKVVLSRAVRWHVENRVLLYGNKTVVF